MSFAYTPGAREAGSIAASVSDRRTIPGAPPRTGPTPPRPAQDAGHAGLGQDLGCSSHRYYRPSGPEWPDTTQPSPYSALPQANKVIPKCQHEICPDLAPQHARSARRVEVARGCVVARTSRRAHVRSQAPPPGPSSTGGGLVGDTGPPQPCGDGLPHRVRFALPTTVGRRKCQGITAARLSTSAAGSGSPLRPAIASARPARCASMSGGITSSSSRSDPDLSTSAIVSVG